MAMAQPDYKKTQTLISLALERIPKELFDECNWAWKISLAKTTPPGHARNSSCPSDAREPGIDVPSRIPREQSVPPAERLHTGEGSPRLGGACAACRGAPSRGRRRAGEEVPDLFAGRACIASRPCYRHRIARQWKTRSTSAPGGTGRAFPHREEEIREQF